MERTRIGSANHIYSENDITSVDVHTLTPKGNDRETSFITIGDENNSIIINSREQWEQVKAFMNKAFDGIE